MASLHLLYQLQSLDDSCHLHGGSRISWQMLQDFRRLSWYCDMAKSDMGRGASGGGLRKWHRKFNTQDCARCRILVVVHGQCSRLALCVSLSFLVEAIVLNGIKF